jgi:hypothetical protein
VASNLGQLYEQKIRGLLRAKSVLPLILETNLGNNDAGFVNNGVSYFVEVKNRTAPDFGQKGLIWEKSSRKWEWREQDVVSKLYDQFGAKKHIDKNFIPRRYTVEPLHRITLADKKYDQKSFEKRGILLTNLNLLYKFYARKSCYYIQIENKGIYYLQRDIANLNVPRFVPELYLRLRAKTHHSNPTYAYSFFAVMTARTPAMHPSPFDLEERAGKFPAIA